jgi:2',3'-cyclic-nucleotide 2'-phosphodiesterase (5'-nucleotidase family)
MKFSRLISLLIFAGLNIGVSVAADLAPAAAPVVPWPPPAGMVSWQDPHATADRGSVVTVHVLTFNDFHGNLQTPAPPDGRRPAGGAAVLAA